MDWGTNLSSEGLFYSSKQAMLDKGAKVYMETPISNINYQDKKVTGKTKNGEEITVTYDKINFSNWFITY